MDTLSTWAPASVVLTLLEDRLSTFPGFPDTGSALVYLTQKLISPPKRYILFIQ